MSMLKTFVTATAIGGLMVSGAFAQIPQQTPPAGSPPATSMPPAATPPAATTPSSPSAATSPNFVSAQTADQWLASKFSGTDVLGPNNEKVGDVSDVLFDKSGKVIALIVGVGGFLGIGQKDVALDMTAFQIVPASTTTSENTGSSSTTGTSTTTTTTTMTDPNDIKLKISMTKDQLKEAPSFERYKAPSRSTGTTGGTTRPATPAR